MNLIRRKAFFISVIFIVFMHMSHASKEISPRDISVVHHKLFDPLNVHLKLQGIELKVEFVNINEGALYLYKKLYVLNGLGKIIKVNRKQSENNFTQAVFNEEDFILQYDDSRNKKNTVVKCIKSQHSNGSGKLNEYKGEHNLFAFSRSFEDWRLSYQNFVSNEPAETESIYFSPQQIQESPLNKQQTNNISQLVSSNKLLPMALTVPLLHYLTLRDKSFLKPKTKIEKSIKNEINRKNK